MRKRRLIIIVMCAVLLVACGRTKYTKVKPDDAMSEAICDAVDGETVYYQGKNMSSDNVLQYKFLILEEEDVLIKQIVDTANEVLKNEPINSRVAITCWTTLPGGVIQTMSIKNYSEETLEIISFDALQVLQLYEAEYLSIYNEPSTYSEIKGIKRLELYPEMNTRAEKQGVDWYDYWPELESIEVLSW